MWGQRTTVRVGFPFYHLILSIQLRPLVLVVGPFTHWALTSTQSIVKCNLPRDKACFADKVVLILLLQQIKSQCVRSVCCKMLSVHTWTPGKLSLRITSSILFLTSIYFTLLSPLHMCSNWLDMRHPQPFKLCHTYFFNEGQKNSLIINKRLGENIGLQIRGRVIKIKIPYRKNSN